MARTVCRALCPVGGVGLAACRTARVTPRGPPERATRILYPASAENFCPIWTYRHLVDTACSCCHHSQPL